MLLLLIQPPEYSEKFKISIRKHQLLKSANFVPAAAVPSSNSSVYVIGYINHLIRIPLASDLHLIYR